MTTARVLQTQLYKDFTPAYFKLSCPCCLNPTVKERTFSWDWTCKTTVKLS